MDATEIETIVAHGKDGGTKQFYLETNRWPKL
jgi:hypothetical protein